MARTPIAIVGRGCVLPGAHSPDALWLRLRAGHDLLGRPPAGSWPIDSQEVTLDTAGLRWSDRGGYVDGFQFDPTGFAIDVEEALAADRCAHWVLHASRAALQEAGHDPRRGHRRTGAILGHLSLPLPAQARFAICVWMHQWAQAQGRPELARLVAPAAASATNRHMSALPTRLMARALGLGADAFTLDAACASSLYAIKLACDALEDGRADLMLAGAACGTDPLFLHIGFRALKALSPTGQSRPFHRQANGLVPSEGAVVFALKRLADAQTSGDRILGVIRGVGLSNDGGAAGLLVPSSEGQVRAMRQAIDDAGLTASDIAMLECHATGTPLGDTVELASIAKVYGSDRLMPIGSLKSQIGHLLTVSGGAALLKVLAAFEADVLPGSLPVDDPIEPLASSPVRLLAREAPWPADARRIAGISSFGFGGNNAHLLVQAHPFDRYTRLHAIGRPAPAPGTLAVVGMGVVSAGAADTKQFIEALLTGTDVLQAHSQLGRCGLANDFTLPAQALRFPPKDLADCLPQQVMLLKVVAEALSGMAPLPSDRTGVLVGMECDPEIARQMARCMVPAWSRTWFQAAGEPVDQAWVQRMADAFTKPLEAAAVTGSLPNITANRINSQWRLGGCGYSVCADELSGLRALDIAARALHRQELDAAIVAAIDLGCEPVNFQAMQALAGEHRTPPGDAAVVLVIKRLADAQRAGDRVLALVDPLSEESIAPDSDKEPGLGNGPGAVSLHHRFGYAHAASGLLHVAAAVVACLRSVRLGPDGATPWVGASARHVQVSMRAQGDQHARVVVSAGPQNATPDAAAEGALAATPRPGQAVRFPSHMPALDLPAPPRSLHALTHTMHVIDPTCATKQPADCITHKPVWSRADLEDMSKGRISKYFGARFTAQDGYARQVRMPEPPLLMADRVMAIEGEPGSMGLGRIVTETDITPDAWYLHQGSMPAGLEVEAGQADLLLISYLGADLLNRGERVYRLLGCEMTYHGERRPRVGDTLRYEIEVTGHARMGDVRLFFFRYDSYVNGQLRLSVRNGRAGFFTDQELDTAGGVLWDPQKDRPDEALAHHPDIGLQGARLFTPRQVTAFAQGRGFECFGAGFERMASHHRTPRIQEGRMQLFEAVDCLDPLGGPWERGYMRATFQIRGDEWFFPGHFHNDPTMPGTLMCEAGIQMMGFYLAAQGHTIDRDGWTFELVAGATFSATCRGQVTPRSKQMTYEIFVRAFQAGEHPTLWADVLLTVDGRKAFHGRNLGVRLCPGVPLEKAVIPAIAPGGRPPAQVDGFTFDGAAMLHCATGLPSLAFGPRFKPFDGARNLPRLPSAPYQFMSRVTRCEGPIAEMKVGSAVEIEYDIPQDAWYFDDNDGHTMPFAILLEAVLQPCGWLAAYMGVPLHCKTDLCFRNLDGDGTLMRPVYRGDGILRTFARCTSLVRNGDTFIESFDVESHIGDEPVYKLKTVFGHFTAEALSAQKGLAASEADRHAMHLRSEPVIDLGMEGRSSRLPRLARGQLLMLDRVTGFWPQGGAAGRGRLLGEFDVDPNAWFFKAHFYRDPVQPGSLGIEAMVQLLQFYMRDRGLAVGFRNPRFEPLAVGRSMAWKYRGQVLPKNRRVSVEVEIAEEGRDDAGPWVSANAWLWVDGLRIYQAKSLTVRIVEGDVR